MNEQAPEMPQEYTQVETTLELHDVHRTFVQGPREINVLRGVDLVLHPGETVALVGPSGAGKSTLLQIAGLLERPDSGSVIMDNVDCVEISDRQRTRMRRFEIGFVYQSHRLLPEFSALENVVLPQRIAGLSKKQARERAMALLEMLDLTPRADHRPAELSGGEQQRVAIARAVANGPRLLLADEPTGNLDVNTGERVFSKLLSIVRESGLAALIATHNLDLAARMDRVVHLENGLLVESTT